MSSLYELTAEYQALLEMAEDPDIDEQAITDTLEALGGEIESKADGYGMVLRNLSADIDTIKAEIDRLTARKRTIERNIDRMKDSLKYAMVATDKPKFKTALFSFSVRNNAPSVIMDEQYIENIPEEYLTMHEPTVNKTAIKDAIKAGADLSGIAHLESSTSVIIK